MWSKDKCSNSLSYWNWWTSRKPSWTTTCPKSSWSLSKLSFYTSKKKGRGGRSTPRSLMICRKVNQPNNRLMSASRMSITISLSGSTPRPSWWRLPELYLVLMSSSPILRRPKMNLKYRAFTLNSKSVRKFNLKNCCACGPCLSSSRWTRTLWQVNFWRL